MTAEQFAYWLQGYAELNDAPPSPEQWQMIREHLALVFNKVTPSLGHLGVMGLPPPIPARWAQPATSDWGHGTILVSGDGETRLVC